MPKIDLVFSYDEIHKKIPYDLICETRESRVWNTMHRKHRWSEEFTERERETARRLFRQAHTWYLVKGVPNKVRMNTETYRLWLKIGEFCASL